MRAMLHYALLKSLRERSMWAFVLGPLVLIGAPIIGFVAEAAYVGRPTYPVTLQGMSVADFERAMSIVAAAAAAAVAGAAAFWCFRSDLANRSLAFFLLGLRRPVIAPVAAVLFGTCIGMAAFAATVPLIALATGMLSRVWLPAALVAAISGVVAAAIGTAFAAYSPAPGTLAMVLWIGAAAAVVVHDGLSVPTIAVALAIVVVLLPFASRGMERRCAA